LIYSNWVCWGWGGTERLADDGPKPDGQDVLMW
jgi:hypothetical protein